jgi:hypothetical protein
MFPLDEKFIETPLEAGGYTVWHRLERPSKAQQIERDTRIKSEEITHGERIETIYDDDHANIQTWNECAKAIKGYDLGNGASAHDWPQYTHVLRRPSESEWGAYHRSALKIYQVRGAKVPRWISNPNLTAAITLYDALLTRLEGVTLGGVEYDSDKRDEFLKAVDPSHKRAVVRAFAEYWSADLAN